MTTSANYNCSVTNSLQSPQVLPTKPQPSWDGSIVAINAFQQNNNPNPGYEQTLSYLPFANGATTLGAASTSTLSLDVTSVNSKGQTITNTLYNLIFAQSNNLFPILNTSAMLGFVPPCSYPQ